MRDEKSQDAKVRSAVNPDARFRNIARLLALCCTGLGSEALFAANWTNLTVDPARDGYWCSVAFSPSNHLPCVASPNLSLVNRKGINW
jgi:hypothetical protein